MGSVFGGGGTVVQAPSSSQTQGTTEIEPWEEVAPYIETLLPQLEAGFNVAPQLYQGPLVPGTSAQTAAARGLYGQVGETAAGFTPGFQTVYDQMFGQATAAPGTSALYQAQTGDIANQARQLTERDKQLAQQQAMQAGQFGLGSTALGELQALQQQKREETVQSQLASALGSEEQRRMAAAGALPGMAQSIVQSQMTPAQLQEAIGRDVESRQGAEYSDLRRLSQQQQEAERAQAITYANLLGGLAGLGSSTQMQQTSSGSTGQVIPGTSIFQQLAGAAGTAASAGAFSDIRLKTEIKRVGELENGIPVYRWKWTKEAKKIVGDQGTLGVLAQEILKIMPEAVSIGSDGYYRVDYGRVVNG
tara:strand:- start:74 stop:1159 length:1086 start_codon:yes stop_codon:yes gene_type:complete